MNCNSITHFCCFVSFSVVVHLSICSFIIFCDKIVHVSKMLCRYVNDPTFKFKLNLTSIWKIWLKCVYDIVNTLIFCSSLILEYMVLNIINAFKTEHNQYSLWYFDRSLNKTLSVKLISPWTKCLPFHRQCFQMYECKVLYFDTTFSEVCS